MTVSNVILLTILVCIVWVLLPICLLWLCTSEGCVYMYVVDLISILL